MEVRKPTNSDSSGLAAQLADLLVTLILWAYFIFAFLFLFIIFYLTAYLFAKNRERAFQRLNHLYYKGFFSLAKIIIPRNAWQVDTNISKIRSSVIVCNHLSYLDPLIMISLFAHHKTIAKTKFFHVPVFGWLMRSAGYLPSSSDKKFSFLMIKQIEQMNDYLNEGGNLIIFPEGTRNTVDTIGPLNDGAFKIALRCKAPISVLRIHNSNKLFTPGKFLFNAHSRNTIVVELIDTIIPYYHENMPSIEDLKNLVQQSFAGRELR